MRRLSFPSGESEADTVVVEYISASRAKQVEMTMGRMCPSRRILRRSLDRALSDTAVGYHLSEPRSTDDMVSQSKMSLAALPSGRSEGRESKSSMVRVNAEWTGVT